MASSDLCTPVSSSSSISSNSSRKRPLPAFPLLCHDTLIDVFRFFDRRALSRAVEPLCRRFRVLFRAGRLFAVFPTKQLEWLTFSKEARLPMPGGLEFTVCAYSAGSKLSLTPDHPLLGASQAPPPEYVRATRVKIWMEAIVDRFDNNGCQYGLHSRNTALIERFAVAGTFDGGSTLFLEHYDRPQHDTGFRYRWHIEQLLPVLMASNFFPGILSAFRAIRCDGSLLIALQPSFLANLLAHCRVLRFDDGQGSTGPRTSAQADIVRWLNQPLSAARDRGKERILCVQDIDLFAGKGCLPDLAKQLIAQFASAQVAQPYTLYITSRTESNVAQHSTTEEVLARNERTGECLLRCTPAKGNSLLAQYPSTDSKLFGLVPLTGISAVFSRHSLKQPGEVPTFKSAH